MTSRYRNGVTVPEQVWLGMEKGRWPVQCFPDKEMALRWAAKETQEIPRVIFGPVDIPLEVPMYKAEIVPASQKEVPLR
jgi:hypothetical protein